MKTAELLRHQCDRPIALFQTPAPRQCASSADHIKTFKKQTFFGFYLRVNGAVGILGNHLSKTGSFI